MHGRTNRITALIAGLAMFITLHGQKTVNSPYARFGLGLIEQSYSFRSAGMGGASVALRDYTSVAWSNPASYSSVDTNSFVFDFGLDYTGAVLKDETRRHFSSDFNFDHLVIAFPLSKKWGLAAGILPYSNGYYYISRLVEEGDPDYDPIAGEYSINHKGAGGITRAFIGTGAEILPNLSAGINMNILFGKIYRINEYYFESDLSLFSSRLEENLSINGISFETGLQYNIKLNDKSNLTPAMAYSFGTKYRSDYANINLRYANYTVDPYSPDTISAANVTNGEIFIPGTFSLGLGYSVTNKFAAAIEYVNTNWSKSTVYGSEGILASTGSFRAGAEYIPDKFSIYNFFNRLEYRLGGHISDNYLVINGEQVKEFGITFGIGIQMNRSSWSKLNLFFDYNSRGGSLNNGLHKENCYSVGISLNLYDYWFMKAKYD